MKTMDSKKIQLGLLVVIGSVLFVAAVYLIGQRQELFKKTFTISAQFRNVNGLKNGNNVRYSGLDIGTVKKVYMVNDSMIRVDMALDEKIIGHIRKNAIATIGADGLVGNMVVNIVPGKGSAPVVDNGDILESYSKISADDILNTLSTTNENAAILTSDLLKITNRIVDGEGTIGVLLNDTVMAKELKQTIANLNLASKGASATVNKLNGLVETLKTNDESVLGVLLNDTISGERLKTVVQNMESLSVDMESVVGNINKMVLDIQSSKGTLNYILNDTTLVRDLKTSADNIKQGTDKFNENMEALKHNILFRGYFKKLEREQEREAKKANKN
ncbi:MlaD family protein [Mangrovimonas sp. DI 80]|uniref:MlaD family protein n=1 Tax=Mangrovimonas sp. DI 80 TaxID=1779330 RepID=UPI000978A5A3|nr:MlaD family protein [Mangrovimonas sp. DI 80]OMP31845.1 ABC transporter permease [Mangrovimonas sp. DI 80]